MKVGPCMAPKSSAQSSTVNAEQLNAFKIFSQGWNEIFSFRISRKLTTKYLPSADLAKYLLSRKLRKANARGSWPFVKIIVANTERIRRLSRKRNRIHEI